jgi:hypothetical protein
MGDWLSVNRSSLQLERKMANLPLTADTTCSAEGPFCEGLLWVAARRNKPKSADSVEKVGHGLRIRKVRVRD